ncbi:hypothetical protein BDP27DRAFT_1041751 [Rhodocollybia butyracea]|uniref:Uncharacterized protein n=1 Tax=Rhodocollybia butyracea TaxID=206335 RepID=A0A9P5PZQ7_9AGAR|nr:hypothetical protein BDP27DRAFT_1041751 [Rhodocollybia butyracea]
MDPPESLEKIFQRVEEESQKRAQDDEGVEAAARSENKMPIDVQKLKARRRGSISITRFGQLAEEPLPSKEPTSTSPPNSPTTIITALTTQSSFYQSQLLNTSRESLDSHASDNEGLHAEDDNHVTQVHRIAARQTLTRTMGSFLPRRLSRARSRPVIEDMDGTLVIGVSVQAATVEESNDAESRLPTAIVIAGGNDSLSPALNPKASKSSLRSVSSNNNPSNTNWVAKFTKILRRKSGQPLTQTAT